MPRTAKSIRRQLTIYALALAYAVSIIVGIILIVQDTSLTRPEILSAVGLNVVSSVVFAIIFVTLGSHVQARNLEEDIEELFNVHSDRILGHIAERHQIYYPSVEYPPSGDFNAIFNRDLSNSLEQSGIYFFRGPSPRYLPARINMAKRGPARVHVAMLDPTSVQALTRRAVDRRQRPNQRGKSVDEITWELRDELLMSIVALFDCRSKCPIDLIYVLDTGVTRTELFDDSMYISWYLGPVSPGTVFPETLRFPAKSIMYETLKLDMTRQYELFTNGISFHSGLRDDDLVGHLQTLTGEPLSMTDVERWRENYRSFIPEFESVLEELYRNSIFGN